MTGFEGLIGLRQPKRRHSNVWTGGDFGDLGVLGEIYGGIIVTRYLYGGWKRLVKHEKSVYTIYYFLDYPETGTKDPLSEI